MTKKDNAIREKILIGLEKSFSKLLQTKKDRNLDFVISEKGKIVQIKAKDC